MEMGALNSFLWVQSGTSVLLLHHVLFWGLAGEESVDEASVICLVAENINQAWEVVYPRIQTLSQIIWKMQIFMIYLDAYIAPFCGKE